MDFDSDINLDNCPGFSVKQISPGKNRIVIEQEPHYQTITYEGEQYHLPFPWTYYGFSIVYSTRGYSGYLLSIKFSPVKIVNDTNMLITAPIPNINDGGSCYRLHAFPHNEGGSFLNFVSCWQAHFLSFFDSNSNNDLYFWHANSIWSKLQENVGYVPKYRVFKYWETLSFEEFAQLLEAILKNIDSQYNRFFTWKHFTENFIK